MEGNNIYQTFANEIGMCVILAYTKLPKNTPTKTYKLFKPYQLPIKIKHNCKTLAELEGVLFVFSKDHAIFFARFAKHLVHIDPWMSNSIDCFDNVNSDGKQPKRNIVVSEFPESIFGNCLIEAKKSELLRLKKSLKIEFTI